MKKLFKIIIASFILIICFNVLPYNDYIKAEEACDYELAFVDSKSNKTKIGCYSTYTEAYNNLLKNKSTKFKTTTIFKNNEIVNAEYGIARLVGSGYAYLYKNVSDKTAYTATDIYSASDAALLDYNDTYGRYKIKISGFSGWIEKKYVKIDPLSTITSNKIKIVVNDIKVRDDHSTSANHIGNVYDGKILNCFDTYDDGTYLWYKIDYNGSIAWVPTLTNWIETYSEYNLGTKYYHFRTGNLIHDFDYNYNRNNGYTNLGPTPDYLVLDDDYYSFDGNYFYDDLFTMLEDYKNGNFNRAVNKERPHFPYYLYLPVHSKTNYTANDFNKFVTDSGYYRRKDANITYVNSEGDFISGIDRTGISQMFNTGQDFIDAQNAYGTNAFQMFSAGINESTMGTSTLALAKNNLFGHGANDTCWFSCATTFNSPRDAIFEHARLTGNDYSIPTSNVYYGSFYGNKGSGVNVKYATDPYWGEKAASNYFLKDNSYGMGDYMANTFGIKQSDANVSIKKRPTDNSDTIYILKNRNFSVENMSNIVIDKVYTTENGKTTGWYKVYTDISLDQFQNITNGTYNPEYSYGYIKESDIYVSNTQPTISASDKKTTVGVSINLLTGVTATDKEDGNITNSLKVISNNINYSIPGNYQVTYQANDNSNYNVTKTINVVVVGSNTPIINAVNREVSQFTTIDLMSGVSAKDFDGKDLTASIKVTGVVNTQIKGTYEITYSVTNTLGKTTTKKAIFTVVDNARPIIKASNKTIKINSTFDPLQGVTATDKEDGKINVQVITNEVDVTKPGNYTVKYRAVDSHGQETNLEIVITVSNKDSKEALFYLDYLKNVNGRLQILGYNTINGIDNNLNNNIIYKVIFENVDDNTIHFEQTAKRVTDKSLMTRPVYSIDGKDYTYSWFQLDIDLTKLPAGNYRMYVVSESNDYISQSVISNKLYKTQATSFKGDKSVISQINFNDKNGGIVLNVREEQLANKTAGPNFNQYDKFTTFKFNSDNKFNIAGVSYSYGMNLASNQNVSRKIIFENMDTYAKYEYNLGSVVGASSPVLPVNDNLSKIRAWYNVAIDLGNIPVGKYVIYITTSSNITDIAEFTEKLGRTEVIEAAKKTINGKAYSFNINRLMGSRVELIVK